MVKTGGRVFATPLRPPLRTQQVEIAALHELHASAHQTNSFVAQVMRLLAGTCRNEHLTEQAGRNAASARVANSASSGMTTAAGKLGFALPMSTAGKR